MPNEKRYTRAAMATKKDKVESYEKKLEINRNHMKREAKTAGKLEKKLKITTGGYRVRANELSKNYVSLLNDIQEADLLPLTETLFRVARKVFQPPVIGALAGLIIASFPRLRGILENIYGDDVKQAPLKWMFDGIYSVGQAAVPINMTILGINLSSTFQKKTSKPNSVILPNSTMASVVFGKMIMMPIIGVLSTWFLQKYYIDIPDEIDSTVFLVMMIVFICPTANNVMVMVELSGSGSKEGMARLIGWQYFVSPVVLSVVLAAVVHIATALDKHGPG